MNFLVDESLPPRMAARLAEAGHEAVHVYDVGLAGAPDQAIFETAQQRAATVVTRDLDFSRADRFRAGTHAGIIVVRFPTTVRIATLLDMVLRRVSDLSVDDVRGKILIIEPGRTRTHEEN